jgi:hypothetical protein
MDLEQLPIEKRLLNAPVKTLSWSGLTVTVKEGKTGQPKTLVDNVEGIMQAGWLTAFPIATNNGLLNSPQVNAVLSWAHQGVARPRS